MTRKCRVQVEGYGAAGSSVAGPGARASPGAEQCWVPNAARVAVVAALSPTRIHAPSGRSRSSAENEACLRVRHASGVPPVGLAHVPRRAVVAAVHVHHPSAFETAFVGGGQRVLLRPERRLGSSVRPPVGSERGRPGLGRTAPLAVGFGLSPGHGSIVAPEPGHHRLGSGFASAGTRLTRRGSTEGE